MKRSKNPVYVRGYNDGIYDMRDAVVKQFYDALKNEPGIGDATFKKIQNTLDKIGSEM